jgi:chemotaxis protein methyltransferase CheR
LEQLALALAEDGYLIIGATEVFEQMTPAFRPVSGRPGLFVRDPAYNAVAA